MHSNLNLRSITAVIFFRSIPIILQGLFFLHRHSGFVAIPQKHDIFEKVIMLAVPNPYRLHLYSMKQLKLCLQQFNLMPCLRGYLLPNKHITVDI